ncbi:MAG: hypothetical protein JSS14_25210 [Proteobacteria bacterium]|nr:hypothetical protein [Pseudomonadota bacterium]
MGLAAVREASAGRLGRLLARIELLPDDLRSLFVSTIVHGKPKADVCKAGSFDGAAFDERYSRMLRELKRDRQCAHGASPKQGIRLRFSSNYKRP